MKNKRDRLFFTQLFVPQASQSSYDRRAELDVRLAIPSAQSACGMEIFTKNGMAVSAMPFFYRCKRCLLWESNVQTM
ncbi:MAG: hypothetical protein ACLR09_15625 [Gallintestinimicrobium sp.]